ncbi:MAG: sigma-70 family RNA polymerase sigma factor [Endomicrobium sp.]|jgi:RNA polymerase sigma-70 factor (ECF subfamily)|nr:sigma-70 family RNA polymerase sigma factor [Endomicrobium sp.]
MENLNDSELVALFKKGNSEAFEALVMRYQSQVYSYIMSITKDFEISNDVMQEVFIRAFKKLTSYKDENKLKNWLFILSKNIVMDYYRKNSYKLLPLETQDDDGFSLIDVLSDNAPLPLEIAIANDKAAMINNALNKLSADERELIALKDYLTFQDIARMQNKPLGTLLSKFNRALGKLRKILAKNGQEGYDECMR